MAVYNIIVSVYCECAVPPGMCKAGFHMCRSAAFAYYCPFSFFLFRCLEANFTVTVVAKQIFH